MMIKAMKSVVVLFLMPALMNASYPRVPELSCRPDNDTVHVEVCVPGLNAEPESVSLKVKSVVDGERLCFATPFTVCEESVRNVEQEVCVDNYQSSKQSLHAQTVEVSFEEKSETMKVTSCRPTGKKGYGGYESRGEDQVCREEYQTQQYSIPRVDIPKTVYVEVSVPQAVPECSTVTIEVTESQCREELGKERCVRLPELQDELLHLEQSTAGLGYPKCTPVALTLPIEQCSKNNGYTG